MHRAPVCCIVRCALPTAHCALRTAHYALRTAHYPLPTNDMPSWNDIDLATVPVISDFTVELREMDDAGKLVHFVSLAHGELAWFPGWENADRDLRHFAASDVPMGTIDEPFDDRDDGWRIVIFEHGGYVYI